MEELNNHSVECPPSTTVRRNPPRRAKTPATTTTTTSLLKPTTSPSSKSKPTPSNRKNIPSFPLQDILECQVSLPPPPSSPNTQNLRVFLRIKPNITPSANTNITSKRKGGDGSKAKPNLPSKVKSLGTKSEAESCIVVNDSQSVTLTPPQSMQDAKRLKSEVYDGFTHVFEPTSTQEKVYEEVMQPLVMEFLSGKSGMIATLGPTGSGKTHTIFGSTRQPGLLSLALATIFHGSQRSYYISVFEIHSERGKQERLIDLTSSDGPDLVLQQSTIKGLQEVIVSSVTEAEAVIARGTLRRSTAMTNSNSQSSRSQCIISIRGAPEVTSEVENQPNSAVLTVVDLAGAEREKKTGNQGTRLMESNFINNTSMVFGLCLRSLLEHQKNPKKPLQKHFQNSLLTKYLRDYLEGRKRMALILTVKSGADDYLDASFLLRQASPYMKIKFNIVEEPFQKRNISKQPRVEKSKRRKLSDPNAYAVIDEAKGGVNAGPILGTETVSAPLQQPEVPNDSVSSPSSVEVETNESAQMEEYRVEMGRLKRNEHVMGKFSRALWNVLKQYKTNLEESEKEVQLLKKSLEKANIRCMELENENEELKSCALNPREHSIASSSCIQESEKEVQHLKESLEKANIRCMELENEKEELRSCALNPREHSIASSSCIQAESNGTVVDRSNLPVQDPTQMDNQSYESPNISGGGVKYMDDKLLEVKDGLSSASKADLILSSAIEQALDGGSGNTVFGKEAFTESQIPDEEARAVDSCNVRKSDFEHELPCNNFIVEKPRILPSTPSKSVEKIDVLNLEVANERPKAFQCSQESSNVEVGPVHTCSTREIGPENISPCKSLTEKKPRRRLLPASSILLREINNLDLEEETERPTASKGGRKIAPDVIGKTQGSMSLLKLLNNLQL